MQEKNQNQEMPDKPQTEFWEFGDAYFHCNRCGNLELLDKGIKDGLQYVLPISAEHEWKMTCSKCGSTLKVFWKKSDEETVKKAKEKIAEEERKRKEEERKKEEQEAEKKLLEEDGSKKKNTKKGSKKRDSKSNERPTQSDGEGEAVDASID